MKNTFYAAFFWSVASWLVTSRVLADEPTTPVPSVEVGEVKLKDGASLRGTIVTVEPGNRVVVIVAGTQSVIPWDQIAEVVDGKGADHPSQPSQPSQPNRAMVAPAKEAPIIHIDANRYGSAELLRVESAPWLPNGTPAPISTFQFICKQPCDKPVDVHQGDRFVISGPGILPSGAFALEGLTGPVTARIKPNFLRAPEGNIAAMGLGTAFIATGIAVPAFMFSLAKSDSSAKGANDSTSPALIGIFTGAGGLVFIGGVYLVVSTIVDLASSGKTEVKIEKTKSKQSRITFDHGVLRF
jgi:hypothetical protein